MEVIRSLTFVQAGMQVAGKEDDNPRPRSAWLVMEEINDMLLLNCTSLPSGSSRHAKAVYNELSEGL